MERFKRIPFYTGVAALVLAVLVTSVQIGTKGQLTQTETNATQSQAVLSFQFTNPDIITLLVSSDVPVAGIDVVIGFEKEKVQILPSTLTAGPHFTATGAVVSADGSTFSFSAIPQEGETASGIVAQFHVAPKVSGASTSSALSILKGTDLSAVLEKSTLTNILSDSLPFSFTLLPQ
jgi:hypothetical protein